MERFSDKGAVEINSGQMKRFKKRISWSISRVLSSMRIPIRLAGSHSSRRNVTISLMQPTRTIARKRKACGKSRLSSLFGLAPGGVYHAITIADNAVGSYPTLSPLPAIKTGGLLSVALIPKVTLAGCYPAPCLRGARTFLTMHLSALQWCGCPTN